MKRSTLQIYIDRATVLIRCLRTSPSPTSVYEEMHHGSIIGLFACVLMAALSGLPGIVLWAAFFGATVGAVIGLLVWLGSDSLDEEPVIPPREPRQPPGDDSDL